MKSKTIERVKYILLLAAISLMHCTTVLAQDSNTGTWYWYNGNNAFAGKYNWWNEVQYRNYNFVGDLQQLLLRTGVGMNLTEGNNNVLLGYAFIRSEQYIGADEKSSSNEHRIFQQFITKQNFGRFGIQHRYRLEERLLEQSFQDTDLFFRFRYACILTVPLNKQAMEKGTVYLNIFDEIFIQPDIPMFDRNRLFGAVGYAFQPGLRCELGFMSQMLETTYRNQFMVVFVNTLPF